MALGYDDFTWGGLSASTRHGPFAVTIFHDDFATHPADLDDGFPPVLHTWADGRGICERGTTFDLQGFFSTVSPAWVSRHWRDICLALDCADSSHTEEVDFYRDEHDTLSSCRQWVFADFLRTQVPDSALFDVLVALYSLAGVPAFSLVRTGYCQGDYLRALIVYTPEFCERMGLEAGFDYAADADGCMDTLAAWTFGDVWGFAIEDAEGDVVDSCSGFYGRLWDGDVSGLWCELNAALDGCMDEHRLSQLILVPEAAQTGALAT